MPPQRGIEPRSPAWETFHYIYVLPWSLKYRYAFLLHFLSDVIIMFKDIKIIHESSELFLLFIFYLSKALDKYESHIHFGQKVRVNRKYFWKRSLKSFGLVGRKHTKYRYMGNYPGTWQKVMSSPAGNRTPVSRVTGGDTYHYTTEELVILLLSSIHIITNKSSFTY